MAQPNQVTGERLNVCYLKFPFFHEALMIISDVDFADPNKSTDRKKLIQVEFGVRSFNRTERAKVKMKRPFIKPPLKVKHEIHHPVAIGTYACLPERVLIKESRQGSECKFSP